MTVVISATQFKRIHDTLVQDKQPTTNHQDLKLHRMSNHRVATWSNTLQAQRKHAENARRERLNREEEERIRVDKLEAEIQRLERQKAVDRANAIMYVIISDIRETGL